MVKDGQLTADSDLKPMRNPASAYSGDNSWAEKALMRSTHSYLMLAESIPGIVYRIFLKEGNRIRFLNRKLERMTGFTEAEISHSESCALYSLILPEERPKVIDEIRRAIRLNQPFEVTYRIHHKNGAIRTLIERGWPITGSDGTPNDIEGVILAVTDRKPAAEKSRPKGPDQEPAHPPAPDPAPHHLLADTKQKRTEEAFRRPELEKSLALENASELISYQDTDLKIVWVNKAGGESVGARPEDLVGRHCYEIWQQREEPCEGCPVVEAIRTGRLQEKEMTTPDGRAWIIRGNPVKDEAGKIVGVIETTLEISARKQVEEALRQTEERFRNIVESTPVGMHMYRAEPDGRLIFTGANPSADDILGIDHKQLIGRTIEEAFPPLADTEVPKAYRDTALTGRAWESDEVAYEGAGITGVHEVHAFQTSPGRVVAAFTDITERKRTEKELRIRNRIAGIFLTTADDQTYGDILDVIMQATKSQHGLFGYMDASGALICPSVTEDVWKECQIPGEDMRPGHGRWSGTWDRAIDERKVLYSNAVLPVPDGRTAIARILVAPIVDQDDLIGVIALANKPTDYDEADRRLLEALAANIAPILKARFQRDREERRRKEMQQEKERMQSRLLEGHKLEAFGTLAGGIAHDFNNLLSSIQSSCDLALLKVEETSALHRDLTEVREASARAADLTRQLLLFSRKQPMEVSVVDINVVLRVMLDMLTRLIGENICVRASFDPSVWAMRGDRGKIEQAIVNLVLNARDAMPDGGQIAITTENVTLDKDQCALIPGASPGRYVCLSVSDEGVGMDEATLQHIFEPFFTTKEAGRGTGLGLSMVEGIVRQHGGWINAYSDPGKGSTFKVFFSAMIAPTETTSEKKLSLQRFQGQGERVLVVEDEDSVRELVARILTENGYTVVEAAGVVGALRVFDRENAQFDLVVSDVVLSDGNGVDLIDQLRSRKPTLAILLNSGYTDERSQWAAICEKGFRFLHKPFTLIDLLQAVRSALERPEVAVGGS